MSDNGRKVRGAVPGRVGGLSTSKAKQRAARENGRLGGRPKTKSKLQQAEEALARALDELQGATATIAELEARLARATKPPEPPPDFTKGRFGLIDLD